MTLPWVTLAGLADRPGTLGRIGAITPAQARQLALAAAGDPTAQWRVIVTSPAGHAIAVARIRRPARRRRDRSGSPARDGPPAGPGPAGRLTLTISQDTITALRPGSTGPPARNAPPTGIGPRAARTGPPGGTGPPEGTGPLDRIIAAALRTAERALQRALIQAEADTAVGGCAHTAASDAYRPPPRLREYVIARDLTCRNPVCGQPASRADLDHTIPWEQGGADLQLQPRRCMPTRPPAQTASPLETNPDQTGLVRMDRAKRPHLHHPASHIRREGDAEPAGRAAPVKGSWRVGEELERLKDLRRGFCAA